MRSVNRFLVTLPFPALFVAWTPVQPPQPDPIKETRAKRCESIAAPRLPDGLGAVGENQPAFAGLKIDAGSTTAVSSEEPKKKTAKNAMQKKTGGRNDH